MHALIRQGNGKYYVSAVFGYYRKRSKDNLLQPQDYNKAYWIVWNPEKKRLIRWHAMEPNTKYIIPQVLIIDSEQSNWITDEHGVGCVDFLSKELLDSFLNEQQQPADILDKCRAMDSGYVYNETPEIKTQKGEMVYLYCSDVESSVGQNNVSMGIFDETKHVSISVIACDTEKVTDMSDMFFRCSGLTVLDLEKFNTTNVKNMMLMFANCSNLTKLDLKNFNTTNVEKMEYMFYGCSNLKNLELGKDFNTTNVTTMSFMFCNCKNLTKLEIVEKFNTTNVKDFGAMFDLGQEDIKNKILGENE